MNKTTMSIGERKQKLEREIKKYIRKGYRVTYQTDTSAQLVRPKKFSFLWAFLWLLALGIGIIVYLIYYAAKRDDEIFIEITETGKVKRRKKLRVL